MGYPDYSSSTGWPYFARREYDNAARDRGRITVRRNYATPSALVIWPGSPQPTHVVGMKTKR
jgi:hypothetical protein